jgi:peptidoglycan/LPS O-acetylase OafA/YrhL
MGVLIGHGWYWQGGYLGVDLFFVLSGFLITALLLREQNRGGVSFVRFYARRARRLLPALFLLLAVMAAIDRGHASADLVALTYTTNIVVIHHQGLMLSAHLTHLWSLAAEEQFYFIWPLALVFLLRRRARPNALIVVLVLLAAASVAEALVLAASSGTEQRIWFAPDTHAYLFFSDARRLC